MALDDISLQDIYKTVKTTNFIGWLNLIFIVVLLFVLSLLHLKTHSCLQTPSVNGDTSAVKHDTYKK